MRKSTFRFAVRFRIGNRLGAKSIYTLRDICVCIVDKYSLTDAEIEALVVTLPQQIVEFGGIEFRRLG